MAWVRWVSWWAATCSRGVLFCMTWFCTYSKGAIAEYHYFSKCWGISSRRDLCHCHSNILSVSSYENDYRCFFVESLVLFWNFFLVDFNINTILMLINWCFRLQLRIFQHKPILFICALVSYFSSVDVPYSDFLSKGLGFSFVSRFSRHVIYQWISR